MDYAFRDIEKKWQAFWASEQVYKAENGSDKPKFYVLDMFPYPSGAGLHVGHPLGYIASDIVARYKRHCGFNVLHPMGYDSFGLPAEQYAIQTGQHPAQTTAENIKRYRGQLDKMGFSFDWSREVRTSDPAFYRFTQWIFLQLFDSWYDRERACARPIEDLIWHLQQQGTAGLSASAGEALSFSAEEWAGYDEALQEQILQNYRLAYRAESTVNWCPALGTVLANDEVKEGRSERGGYPVEQKKMMQWSLRITAYAERLLSGMEGMDWPLALKEAQRNWIGRSEGAAIEFSLAGHPEKITVFSTRPDTIFGASFMVLAPEHELVEALCSEAQREEIENYRQAAARKSERERMSDVKSVTGAFTGAYALHPFTGEKIPIWIADYVLAGYGTGAVMAVPAHDSRDWAFAKKFDLPILPVVSGGQVEVEAFEAKEGRLINSDFLNDLSVPEAIQAAIARLEEKNLGAGQINYRLRDAVFGRQRYWGEPIPIYYVDGLPRRVKEEHLPLELPAVDAFLPTEAGDPPLARAQRWHYHPDKGVVGAEEGYPLETTTMPGWAGSSWYDLRYMDPHNTQDFADRTATDYWQQVDLYVGGSEHATGHLLYTRFWHKFLRDRGWLQADEPFKKLVNQGMILGESAFAHRLPDSQQFISASLIEGRETQKIHAEVSLVEPGNKLDIAGFKAWREDLAGAEFICDESGDFYLSREVEKMSKSKYNVVNPDEIIERYGADTLRMYEMFLGPLEQSKPWNTAGITGVHGFLKKLWRLYHREASWAVSEEAPSAAELKILHSLLKKLHEDFESLSFNTSVSAFMIAVNELSDQACNKRAILAPLAIALSPFAPHIAEELWDRLGEVGSITRVAYPAYDEAYLQESECEYPVSFNGKKRFSVSLAIDLSVEEIEAAVRALPQTEKYLEGKAPKKVVVVPKRIINFVY